MDKNLTFLHFIYYYDIYCYDILLLLSTQTKATPFGDLSNRVSTFSSNSSGQSSSSGNTISVLFGPLPERTPSRTPTTKNSGAQVLTSAVCLTLLEEKEEKKK